MSELAINDVKLKTFRERNCTKRICSGSIWVCQLLSSNFNSLIRLKYINWAKCANTASLQMWNISLRNLKTLYIYPTIE